MASNWREELARQYREQRQRINRQVQTQRQAVAEAANRARANLRSQLSELEREAIAAINKIRKAEAMEQRKRALPLTRPKDIQAKERIADLSKQRSTIQASIAKVREDIAQAETEDLAAVERIETEAMSELSDAMSKADKEARRADTEYEEAQAEFDKAQTKAQTEAQAKQEKQLATLVEVKGGYMGKAEFEALAADDQALVKRVGVDKFNELKERQQARTLSRLIELKDGSFVSKLQFGRYTKREQDYLIEHGVDKFNAWAKEQAEKASAVTITTTGGMVFSSEKAEAGYYFRELQASGDIPKNATLTSYDTKTGEISYTEPSPTLDDYVKQWRASGMSETELKIIYPLHQFSDWILKTTSMGEPIDTRQLVNARVEIFGSERRKNDPKGYWKDLGEAVSYALTPFKWTKDADKMSTTAVIVNSAIDIIYIGSIVLGIGFGIKGLRGLNASRILRAARAAGKAQVKLDRALKTLARTPMGSTKYARAVNNVQRAIYGTARGRTVDLTKPFKPTKLKGALGSLEADKRFIDLLERTQLTTKQLSKLEKASKIKGLKGAILDVNKARLALDKAWKPVKAWEGGSKAAQQQMTKVNLLLARLTKLAKRKPDSKAYARLRTQVREAQAKLDKLRLGSKAYLKELANLNKAQAKLEKLTPGSKAYTRQLTKIKKIQAKLESLADVKLGGQEYIKQMGEVKLAQGNLTKTLEAFNTKLEPRYKFAPSPPSPKKPVSIEGTQPYLTKTLVPTVKTFGKIKQTGKVERWGMPETLVKLRKPTAPITDTKLSQASLRPGEQISPPAVALTGATVEAPKPFGYTGLKMGELGGAAKPVTRSGASIAEQFVGGITSPLATEEGIALSRGGGGTRVAEIPTGFSPALEQATRVQNVNLVSSSAIGRVAPTVSGATSMTIGQFALQYPKVISAVAQPIIELLDITKEQIKGTELIHPEQIDVITQITDLPKTLVVQAIQTGTLIAVLAQVNQSTKLTTSQQVALKVSTITNAAIKALQKTSTATLTNTELKSLVMSEVKSATQTVIKTITQTKVQQAFKVKQAIKTKVGTITKAVTAKILRPRIRIPPPIIIRVPDDDKKRDKKRTLTEKEVAGAVGWKQGWIYKLIFPPYGKNQIINTKKPIAGIKYHEGARSAYKSIIRLGGKLPKTIERDMGIMDIIITTPKGKQPKIAFRPDIRQRTTLTRKQRRPKSRRRVMTPEIVATR